MMIINDKDFQELQDKHEARIKELETKLAIKEDMNAGLKLALDHAIKLSVDKLEEWVKNNPEQVYSKYTSNDIEVRILNNKYLLDVINRYKSEVLKAEAK